MDGVNFLLFFFFGGGGGGEVDVKIVWSTLKIGLEKELPSHGLTEQKTKTGRKLFRLASFWIPNGETGFYKWQL